MKEEIEKVLKAIFIRPTMYVQWLANIFHVMKKNDKLRVCVDFRDLNVSTPNIELLSFMDGFFGYN